MNWLYLTLNMFFTSMAVLTLWPQLKNVKVRPALGALLIVGLLTLVFDNVIVGLGLVGYNNNLISGIRLWFAPIEDFGYVVIGAFLVPALWQRFGRNRSIASKMGKD